MRGKKVSKSFTMLSPTTKKELREWTKIDKPKEILAKIRSLQKDGKA